MIDGALAKRLQDANVRIETLFWAGGLRAQPTTGFNDFVSEVVGYSDQILKSLPWVREYCGEDSYCESDASIFLEDLEFRGIDGFFAELATPIPKKMKPSGAYSESWGHVAVQWVFARSLEELVDIAETWRKEILKKAGAKAVRAKAVKAP